MKRVEEIKAAFASPTAFKSALQTTGSHNGDSHYNKDLLPSPPGNRQYPDYPTALQSDIPQLIEDGDGNTSSPST
jgi:hypothetical protein